MRDDELDEMLKPLRDARPSDADVARWRRAMRRARAEPRGLRRWTELAAAAAAGVAIGAAIFGARSEPEKFVPTATSEIVSIKLD